MAAVNKRGVAIGLLAALVCFGLGVGAARLSGSTGATSARPPQILIDGRSVNLLPDASLQLDLRDLQRAADGGAR
jgi:hypothetical protein